MRYAARHAGAAVVLLVFGAVTTGLALTPARQAAPPAGQGQGAAPSPAPAAPPAQGRRGGPPPGRGGGIMGAGPSDLPSVDAAAADRGRPVYAAECINCHGTQARGTEQGRQPGALARRAARSLRQRARAVPEEGPSDAERRPAPRLTDAQIIDLAHFLRAARQRHAARLAGLHGAERADRRRQGGRGVLQRRGQVQHVPFADRRSGRDRRRGYDAGRSAAALAVSADRPRRGGAAAAPPASAGHRDGDAAVGPAGLGRARRRWTTSTSRCATRAGAYRSFKRTPDLKVVKTDPLARAHRAARHHHRQEHARPRRLPGDAEMRRHGRRSSLLGASCSAGRSRSAGQRRPRGSIRRSCCKPPHRLVADLQRRLLGPPLQPARRRSTPTNVDALSLGWVYRAATRARARGSDQGHAAAGQRRAVLHRARSRVGGRRAHRPRDLAPPWQSTGGIHIGNRGVGDSRRLAVSSRRRTAISSR